MHILALKFTVILPKKITIQWQHKNITSQSVKHVTSKTMLKAFEWYDYNIKSTAINEIKIDVSIPLEEITCVSHLKRSASGK